MPTDRIQGHRFDMADMSADLIAGRRFAQTWRGYEAEEVKEFLAQVADQVRAFRERLETEIAARRDAEQRALHPQIDEATLMSAVGEQTAAILRSARSAAGEITAKAEANAENLLGVAENKAADLVEEGEALLASRTAEAESAANEIWTRALAEVEDLRNTAQQDAEAMAQEGAQRYQEVIEAAEGVREKILTDLARRRRLATVQIEQLRAGRERLLDAYLVVRRTLDEVTDELQRVDAEARGAAIAVGRAERNEVTGEIADIRREELWDPVAVFGGADPLAVTSGHRTGEVASVVLAPKVTQVASTGTAAVAGLPAGEVGDKQRGENDEREITGPVRMPAPLSTEGPAPVRASGEQPPAADNGAALADTAPPDTALPDTALPDTALPDTAVADTAVADAVLDEPVLDEPVLDDTEADASAAENVELVEPDEAAIDEAAIDEAAIDEAAIDEVGTDEVATDQAASDVQITNGAALDDSAATDDSAMDDGTTIISEPDGIESVRILRPSPEPTLAKDAPAPGGEAPVTSTSGLEGAQERDVDGLFARIRADREQATMVARKALSGDEGAQGPAAGAETDVAVTGSGKGQASSGRKQKPQVQPADGEVAGEAISEAAPAATSETEVLAATSNGDAPNRDAAAVERFFELRNEMAGDLGSSLARKLKRALQDQQNSLLDQLRKRGATPANVLPSEDPDRFVEAGRPLLARAVRSGAELAAVLCGDEAVRFDANVDGVDDLAEELGKAIAGPCTSASN